jgi:hypothetical protein
MPTRILFYPEAPSRPTVVRKLCDVLGFVRTSDPQDNFQIAVKWQDSTTFDRGQLASIPVNCTSILNGSCSDVSKRIVGQAFSEVFGYLLDLDPTSHHGDAVSKSNLNALHDGRIIRCPIAAAQVNHQRVYQRVVDNRITQQILRAYRVPVFGDKIPFLYLQDKRVENRFKSVLLRSSIAEVDDEFAIAEQQQILQFCRLIGMDFGELDVLRDADGRIYIVDANPTPYGPSSILPQDLKLQAILRMAECFASMARQRAQPEARSIILIQSCDEGYFSLLESTSSANSSYAARHGYGYRAEVGNLCPVPNSGNWNRYYLLKQEILSGIYDWAFWMDADAVVRNQTIPLETIIDRTPDKTVIACSGGNDHDHNINNGVFLLNLRHPLAHELVDYAIAQSRRLDPQGRRFQADQPTMQHWLRRYYDGRGKIPLVKNYSGPEHNLFNYTGPFVCHVLRKHGPLEKRLDRLRQFASEALANCPPDPSGADRS